ncbi:MAG: cell division protein ZapD [Gammaproteobacteria bacterium]
MTDKIVYEQPLNEITRTFLRLEFLFSQAAHHLRGQHSWDSRSTLNSLLEIISIFERSDLKKEVLKEIDHQNRALKRLLDNPKVDRTRLDQTIKNLSQFSTKLLKSEGPIVAALQGNDFLGSIQQRSAIPGGTCDFDLPAYHYWLQHSPEHRIRNLAVWLGQFETIAGAIQLILRLVRESAHMKPETAENGFFQKTLNPNHPCQLVRIEVNPDIPFYAEISGGRHRFTVRFMQLTEEKGLTKQTNRSIAFNLGCCALF